MNELVKKIIELKKKKNAIILVHNYQRPEIYKIADFIGDSLELCRKAKETNADIIVFCGVDFMAESAKILNPDKRVFLPEIQSRCPMAGMVNPDNVLAAKRRHPQAIVCSYVNTTAKVKAVSDICCTSANAVRVVNSLKEEEIIFTPDKNLARYVQSRTNKRIIAVEGYCYVHDKILASDVEKAKRLHKDAEVLVHPECKMDVIKLADYVCSTSQMVKRVKESSSRKFIIVTEQGMVNRLRMERGDAEYYSIGGICIQMKKITLEKVYDCLNNEKNEINIPEEIMVKAKKALDRMLSIS